MDRIMELAEYYSKESGDVARALVKKLNLIIKSNDNSQAKQYAEEALVLLKKIAPFDSQITRLERFIKDLEPKVKVQALM